MPRSLRPRYHARRSRTVARATQQLGVDRDGARHRGVERVALADDRLAAAGHGARPRGIGQAVEDRGGQRRGIAGGHEAAGLAVVDQLAAAAHVAGHDRRADGQRLRDHLRGRLRADRGQDQHVERRHHLGDVAAEAGHADGRRPGRAPARRRCTSAKPTPSPTIRKRAARLAGEHGPRRVEEQVVALGAADVGDEADQRRAGQPELGAHAVVRRRRDETGRCRRRARSARCARRARRPP